ncbi:MFS transporter [Actinomadura algeriensis]|uniref:MFS family arabinose efflux permease n=1 Tax=Actinomadura algeriensis TaxID=1679523 RepID=A0ABR9JUW0_9ACTN|nr:MFS transporter [Actinomadura algeriensis]MBE1534352.1 putative MFS family arabinose efflux permease [Actinomadura algeriensis]
MFIAVSAVSRAGGACTSTAAPLLALHLTGSPFYAGLMAAAGAVPNLLAHLPAGVLIDRHDRWQVMKYSQWARVLSIAALLCCLLVLSRFWRLGAMIAIPCLIALESIFATTFKMAWTAALPQLAPVRLLSQAIAQSETQHHVALLLARPLGGIADAISHKSPFVLNLLICTASASMLSHLKRVMPIADSGEKHTGRARDRPRVSGDIKRSFTWIRGDGFLRQSLLVFSITNFFFQMTVILMIVIMKDKGLSSVFIGILLAASGVGGILGSRIAIRTLKLIGLKHIALIATFCWTVMLVLPVFWTTSPLVLVGVWAGVGFVGSIITVARDLYQAANVPRELLGRVASLNTLTAQAPSTLGALCGGVAITWLGARPTALVIFVALWVLLFVIPISGKRRPYDRARISRAETTLSGLL